MQSAGRSLLRIKPLSIALRGPCQLSTAMGCAAVAGSCTPFCSVCMCPAGCAASRGTSTSMLDVPAPASSPTACSQIPGEPQQSGSQVLLSQTRLLVIYKPVMGVIGMQALLQAYPAAGWA